MMLVMIPFIKKGWILNILYLKLRIRKWKIEIKKV